MERRIIREVKSRYPLTTSDLTEDEVVMITGILAANNPAPHQISRPDFPENVNDAIKYVISNIQPVLRRNRIVQMLPGSVGREAQLCATHHDFNPYVIGHMYELLKAEVNDRMDTVDKYADQIHDADRIILRSVQALRRLWGEAPPDGARQLPINYPHPQGNGCEACTLARVVQDPGYLCNLRVALLSRSQSNNVSSIPRLLCFIHTAIQGYAEFAAQIMAESDQMAAGFKLARKRTASLSRRNRRSYPEVEMYLRGQPEHVHPAIREEMFEREQEHHRRYQHETRYGSHIAHRHTVHCPNNRPNRHSVHCPNARPNRHSAHRPRGRHMSQRDTITDDILPHFQQMSLNEGPPRASQCGMHCSSRHSHTPPVPRDAPPSHMRPAPGYAPARHRSSASRHTPSGSGSRTMQNPTSTNPVERRGTDEDALAAQYMHLANHNAAYGWDTDDSDASSVEIPDDEPSRPSSTWTDFARDAEAYIQERQQQQR